jgi:hypothetical protein
MDVIFEDHAWFETSAGRKFLERVGHAHLSAHGPGAFGDMSLAGLRRDSEMLRIRRWLKLLADAHRIGTCPRFTGIVAIELEAARSMRMAFETLEKLSGWGMPIEYNLARSVTLAISKASSISQDQEQNPTSNS